MFFNKPSKANLPEYSTTRTNSDFVDNALITKHQKTITSIKKHKQEWIKQLPTLDSMNKLQRMTELFAIADLSLSLLQRFDDTLSRNWKWQFVITQQQRLLFKELYYFSSVSKDDDFLSLLNVLQNDPKVFEGLLIVNAVEHNRYIEYAQFFEDQKEVALIFTIILALYMIFLVMAQALIPAMIVLFLVVPAAAVPIASAVFEDLAKRWSNDSLTSEINNEIGNLNGHIQAFTKLSQGNNKPRDANVASNDSDVSNSDSLLKIAF